MNAFELYACLENDFIKDGMSDDWSKNIVSINEFVTDSYKKRFMGLVCDFSSEIKKVYTAVFPSDKVMQKIIDDDISDVLLFVHHPANWDIRKAPNVFQDMNFDLLRIFKERRISVYNLHVPLDNYGDFSTSNTFAKALGVDVRKAFGPYHGALCGVMGSLDVSSVDELKGLVEKILGHEVKVYDYGSSTFSNDCISVVGGGGVDLSILEDVVITGSNVLVTGITNKNSHSEKAHEFAKNNKITLVGGSHYSTEKFACIAMVDYFKNLGLDAEFVEDFYLLEDL